MFLLKLAITNLLQVQHSYTGSSVSYIKSLRLFIYLLLRQLFLAQGFS